MHEDLANYSDRFVFGTSHHLKEPKLPHHRLKIGRKYPGLGEYRGVTEDIESQETLYIFWDRRNGLRKLNQKELYASIENSESSAETDSSHHPVRV